MKVQEFRKKVCDRGIHIWIGGNVPSSKNSKSIVQVRGRPMLINSKLTRDYIKSAGWQFVAAKQRFRELMKGLDTNDSVLVLGFYFVRGSRHRFDFHNAIQILMDMMVEHGYLNDDSMDDVYPVPMGYDYDKEEPGVYIVPLNVKSDSFVEQIISDYVK